MSICKSLSECVWFCQQVLPAPGRGAGQYCPRCMAGEPVSNIWYSSLWGTNNIPLFFHVKSVRITCHTFYNMTHSSNFVRTLALNPPTALSPDGVDTSNMIAFGNVVLPANQYLFMTRKKCTFWTVFPQARVPTSWSNHYDTGTVSIYEYQFA